jgi:argininosuccinate lyase
MTEMLSTVTINKERMTKAVYSNYSTATDLADYLVKKGVPFRESHEISGSIVKYCEAEGEDFFSLSLNQLKSFSSVFDQDIIKVLDPSESTERKLSKGSTSAAEIDRQIALLKEKI